MLKKALSSLLIVLLMALLFTAFTLGPRESEAVADPPASLPAVGSANGGDQDMLINLFGVPVPRCAGSGHGVVRDQALGSLTARYYQWQSDDGLCVSAVRPAEAAQLIRRDELTLDTDTRWSVNGITVTVARGDGGACAYYGSEDAAYALYLPTVDTDTLLSHLTQTVTFPTADPL